MPRRHLLALSAALAALALGAAAHAEGVQIDQVTQDANRVGAAALASTNASGTVTTGGTYQTVFAAKAPGIGVVGRKGCLVQNPTTATEVLNIRISGVAVFTLPVGATFSCNFPGGVITDLVEITAATTAHAFTAVSQ